jgi:hypothetical protein
MRNPLKERGRHYRIATGKNHVTAFAVGCDWGIMAVKEWTVKDLIDMDCSFR